jgi:hypothetical protein
MDAYLEVYTELATFAKTHPVVLQCWGTFLRNQPWPLRLDAVQTLVRQMQHACQMCRVHPDLTPSQVNAITLYMHTQTT